MFPDAHYCTGGRQLEDYPGRDCSQVPTIRVIGESDTMIMDGEGSELDRAEGDESDLDENEEDEEEDGEEIVEPILEPEVL